MRGLGGEGKYFFTLNNDDFMISSENHYLVCDHKNVIFDIIFAPLLFQSCKILLARYSTLFYFKQKKRTICFAPSPWVQSPVLTECTEWWHDTALVGVGVSEDDNGWTDGTWLVVVCLYSICKIIFVMVRGHIQTN